MAIKELKREWSPCQLGWVKEFLLHWEKEVTDLPECCVGSKAKVSETGNEYICTGEGWKNINECVYYEQPEWGEEMTTIFSGPVTMSIPGKDGVMSDQFFQRLGEEDAGTTYVINIDGNVYQKQLLVSGEYPKKFPSFGENTIKPYVLGNGKLWIYSYSDSAFILKLLEPTKPYDTGENFAIQDGRLALRSPEYKIGDVVNVTISVPGVKKIPAKLVEHPEPFIVTATVDGAESADNLQGECTADKSFAEVEAAILSGRDVQGRLTINRASGGSDIHFLRASTYSVSDADNKAIMLGCTDIGNYILVIGIEGGTERAMYVTMG